MSLVRYRAACEPSLRRCLTTSRLSCSIRAPGSWTCARTPRPTTLSCAWSLRGSSLWRTARSAPTRCARCGSCPGCRARAPDHAGNPGHRPDRSAGSGEDMRDGIARLPPGTLRTPGGGPAAPPGGPGHRAGGAAADRCDAHAQRPRLPRARPGPCAGPTRGGPCPASSPGRRHRSRRPTQGLSRTRHPEAEGKGCGFRAAAWTHRMTKRARPLESQPAPRIAVAATAGSGFLTASRPASRPFLLVLGRCRGAR